MDINWYPGHMAKAKRIISENLKLVDIVIELLDARVPYSSMNPDFHNLFKDKIRIIILNKNDFADENKSREWADYLSKENVKVILLNALNSKEVQKLKKTINSIAESKREAIKQRKGINKTIRAMVVGIPNVGKSTFINSIAGKSKAKTGDRPGVTKANQWVRINNLFEILDTPGLLWPKLDNEIIGLHLSYTGSIKEDILDLEEICYKFIDDIKELYPDKLKDRYKIDNIDGSGHEILQRICINRGWIKGGGTPDIKRGAKQILDEFQEGKLGRITLETPEIIKAT